MATIKAVDARITIMDVARDAGVSRATVSLVLRDSPLVAAKTRQRVHASIQRLGYVYHRGAASLRTQRTGIVGVIITDLANPFFAELVAGIETVLDAAGVVSILCSTTDTLAKQARFVATLQEHGVDGLLLCPAHDTLPEQLARVAATTPTVLMVREVDRPAADVVLDYIGPDYAGGTAMATAHLLAHGHTRVAFVGGPVAASARRERQRGYVDTLMRAGIAVDERLIVPTPVTCDAGRDAIAALLALPNPPTAALCYNDVVAYGAMLGLRERGIMPGGDFAVVGADDIREAALWQPALTTVATHPPRLGEMAARLLLERIQNRNVPGQRIVLPTQVVVRASCGCASG